MLAGFWGTDFLPAKKGKRYNTTMSTNIKSRLWLLIIEVMAFTQLVQAQDVIVVGTRQYQRTEVKVSTGVLDSNSQGNMTVLTGGNFIVCWHQNTPTETYGQVFDPQGNAVGSIFLLDPYNSYGWHYGPVPAALPGGGLFVSWGDSSSYANAQRFDAARSPVGGQFNTGLLVWPSIASAVSGDVIVSGGTANQPVYARRFNSAGVAYGNAFPVSSNTISGWFHPSVACGPDGRFAIAWWDSAGSIRAHAYATTESSPLGPEFVVNDTPTQSGAGYGPSICYDSSNALVIAWQGSGSADSAGAYARKYHTDGTAYGSEWLVNETTTGNQYTPTLSIGANNEMFISWISGPAIYSRLFDPTGSPISPEFRTDQYTGGTSRKLSSGGGQHANVSLANGNLALAWAGDGASGTGVYLTMLQLLGDSGTRIDIRTSQVELCWNTTSNSWYQLQYRSALTTNLWTPLSGWIAGDGTRYCTNDAVLVSQPQRFYQLSITNSAP